MTEQERLMYIMEELINNMIDEYESSENGRYHNFNDPIPNMSFNCNTSIFKNCIIEGKKINESLYEYENCLFV